MSTKNKVLNIQCFCSQCGKGFLQDKTHADQKFCSKICYHISTRNRVIIKCKKCGKEKEIMKSAVKDTGNYCSRKCSYSSNTFRKQKIISTPKPKTNKYRTKRIKTTIILTCHYCGNIREVVNTSENRNRKYCSKECVTLAKRTRLSKECEYCHKLFIPGRPSSKFCSRDCFIKACFRKNNFTSLEKELYSFLESKNIEFIKQFRIGNQTPDAFIPSLNLCIYADGWYWHNLKDHPERDSRINIELESQNYMVLRLPEDRKIRKLDLTKLIDFLYKSDLIKDWT
jgi:very-short-patch-repair endonuclease